MSTVCGRYQCETLATKPQKCETGQVQPFGVSDMKYAIIGLVIGSVLISGCASDVDKDAKQVQKQQQEKNPEVGMTKAQILSMYGKTDNIQMASEGETWIYHLNVGEAFIPFNFGYRPKTRIITFDQEGKVSHWSYSK
jgi:hypothetical protein